MAFNHWGDQKVGCHDNGIGNSQCDSSELSVFESFLNDDNGDLWPELIPTFDGVSSSMSHPCFNGQQQQQQGQYMNGHNLRGMEFENHNIHDLQTYQFSDFASARQTTMSFNGLHSPSEISPTQSGGERNGMGKPRVRARRGQATDPHSIAERLRREKIADRMKSLQELLPNPNKTDKASMLEEIIEYVKFLQLQVKVLSMSRIGASSAVEPLNTGSQSEDGEELLISPSGGDISDIVFPSSSEMAFEREVVNLMDSNVSKAMQFLQTKGLCLVPVALASAMAPANKNQSGAHRGEPTSWCNDNTSSASTDLSQTNITN